MQFPNPAGREGKKGRELGWRLDGKNTEKGRDKRLGMQGRRVEMKEERCGGVGM
jgi:hypothetical protein